MSRVTYKTLADQVRKSVRSCRGSRWMFRVGGTPTNCRCKLHPRMWVRAIRGRPLPDPGRADPGSARPLAFGLVRHLLPGDGLPRRGAKVLNISVDLGVHGRDAAPQPPIETVCRVIAEPVLRLTSIDLGRLQGRDRHAGGVVQLRQRLPRVGQGGRDRLGLGPTVVGGDRGGSSRILSARVVRPGHGLEVVSKVNDIPKGSRLAVSTNLLASLISLLMRADRANAKNFTGPAGAGRGAGGGFAGDSRGMARRFRRRLAGLRRRFPRRQIDSRRRFGRGARSRVGREPGPAPPDARA